MAWTIQGYRKALFFLDGTAIRMCRKHQAVGQPFVAQSEVLLGILPNALRLERCRWNCFAVRHHHVIGQLVRLGAASPMLISCFRQTQIVQEGFETALRT